MAMRKRPVTHTVRASSIARLDPDQKKMITAHSPLPKHTRTCTSHGQAHYRYTDPVSSVSKQKAQARAPHAFAVFSLSSSFSFSHTLPLSFFPLHICSQAQLHPTVLLSALEMRHRLHTLALDLPPPLPCTYCTHTLEYIHVSTYTSVLYIRCTCTVQYSTQCTTRSLGVPFVLWVARHSFTVG